MEITDLVMDNHFFLSFIYNLMEHPILLINLFCFLVVFNGLAYYLFFLSRKKISAYVLLGTVMTFQVALASGIFLLI